jgi:hypothetical protein
MGVVKAMKRNNFIIKFLYFYKKNLLEIKNFIEDNAVELACHFMRVVMIFIPVLPIYCSCISEYMDDISIKKEEDRLKMRLGSAGYYVKRKQREKDAEEFQKSVEKFRQTSRMQKWENRNKE